MERKLVTVSQSGPIPQLNYIAGPISVPTLIDLNAIIQMVKANIKVYEHDPKDPKNENKKVELTLMNVKKNNFQTVEDILGQQKDEPKSVENSVKKKKEIPVETPVEPTPVPEKVEEPKEEQEIPVETPADSEPMPEEVKEVQTEEDASETEPVKKETTGKQNRNKSNKGKKK